MSKGEGISKRKKIVFIIFAFLVLIGVGIVLLVTYLPVGVGKVKDAMKDSLNFLSGSQGTTITDFTTNLSDQLATSDDNLKKWASNCI